MAINLNLQTGCFDRIPYLHNTNLHKAILIYEYFNPSYLPPITKGKGILFESYVSSFSCGMWNLGNEIILREIKTDFLPPLPPEAQLFHGVSDAGSTSF